MEWTLISGTWKTTDEAVLRTVRQVTRDTLAAGNGIITGGALGVDLAASEECLRRFPDGSRLRIVIPSPLRNYIDHYRQRAEEGVISDLQAEQLINVLEALRKVNPDHLYELAHTQIDASAYYARNTEAVQLADSVIAFSIAKSAGTADTVTKAKNRGIPVTLNEYEKRY